jgi:glucose/arabinose dehydrogenase
MTHRTRRLRTPAAVAMAAAAAWLHLGHPAGVAHAAPPPGVELELLTDDLEEPIALAHAGDDRLFLVEREGRIRIFAGGELRAEPFLDIRHLIDSADGEQGLLGLAFHPRYRETGWLYVAYTRDLQPPHPQRHQKVVARYSVSTADPDAADPASGQILLLTPQPFPNHNGGDLHFAHDGMLWIATGDGGSGGDPDGNAQNLESLLGKMLRVDVDRDDFPDDPERNYGVPPDNPFADGAGADEIWAYGFRNPWRFSFDRRTGDAWVGDVGQGLVEEIDLLPRGAAGLNFGWDCWEGSHPFPHGAPGCKNLGDTTLPLIEYGHAGNCAVTGGYRYRGHVIAGLAGQYVYADFCSGRLWWAEEQRRNVWSSTLWRQAAGNFSAFGEDHRGELYLIDLGGRLLRVTSPSSLFFDDFEDGNALAWSRRVQGAASAD